VVEEKVKARDVYVVWEFSPCVLHGVGKVYHLAKSVFLLFTDLYRKGNPQNVDIRVSGELFVDRHLLILSDRIHSHIMEQPKGPPYKGMQTTMVAVSCVMTAFGCKQIYQILLMMIADMVRVDYSRRCYLASYCEVYDCAKVRS
jgi:hypothetical protein